MTRSKQQNARARAQVAIQALGFALVFAAFCCFPVLRAMADNSSDSSDIQVVAQVAESTPSATPVQSVKLTYGQSIANAQVTVTLTGLEPFSFVQLYVQSDPILICSGFADKYGVFTCKAALPSSLEAGSHSILALAQKLGQATPALQTLAQFHVSLDGTVFKKKPSQGSGSGGTVTESPVPSPTSTNLDDTASQGVIYVGGVEINSQPTFDIAGGKLTAAITIHNAYKRKYSVNVRIETTALGLYPLAPAQVFHVANLKKGETRLLVQTIPNAGQWGFYSSTFTVIPPKSIDGINLKPIVRSTTTFVPPLLVLTIFAVLLLLELLRRFVLKPQLDARRWLRELAEQAENEERERLAAAQAAAEAEAEAKRVAEQAAAKPKRKSSPKKPKPTDESGNKS